MNRKKCILFCLIIMCCAVVTSCGISGGYSFVVVNDIKVTTIAAIYNPTEVKLTLRCEPTRETTGYFKLDENGEPKTIFSMDIFGKGQEKLIGKYYGEPEVKLLYVASAGRSCEYELRAPYIKDSYKGEDELVPTHAIVSASFNTEKKNKIAFTSSYRLTYGR